MHPRRGLNATADHRWSLLLLTFGLLHYASLADATVNVSSAADTNDPVIALPRALISHVSTPITTTDPTDAYMNKYIWMPGGMPPIWPCVDGVESYEYYCWNGDTSPSFRVDEIFCTLTPKPMSTVWNQRPCSDQGNTGYVWDLRSFNQTWCPDGDMAWISYCYPADTRLFVPSARVEPSKCNQPPPRPPGVSRSSCDVPLANFTWITDPAKYYWKFSEMKYKQCTDGRMLNEAHCWSTDLAAYVDDYLCRGLTPKSPVNEMCRYVDKNGYNWDYSNFNRTRCADGFDAEVPVCYAMSDVARTKPVDPALCPQPPPRSEPWTRISCARPPMTKWTMSPFTPCPTAPDACGPAYSYSYAGCTFTGATSWNAAPNAACKGLPKPATIKKSCGLPPCINWRSDLRCGAAFPAPNGEPISTCNPLSSAPCCSAGGWCGASSAYCSCFICADYRNVTYPQPYIPGGTGEPTPGRGDGGEGSGSGNGAAGGSGGNSSYPTTDSAYVYNTLPSSGDSLIAGLSKTNFIIIVALAGATLVLLGAIGYGILKLKEQTRINTVRSYGATDATTAPRRPGQPGQQPKRRRRQQAHRDGVPHNARSHRPTVDLDDNIDVGFDAHAMEVTPPVVAAQRQLIADHERRNSNTGSSQGSAGAGVVGDGSLNAPTGLTHARNSLSPSPHDHDTTILSAGGRGGGIDSIVANRTPPPDWVAPPSLTGGRHGRLPPLRPMRGAGQPARHQHYPGATSLSDDSLRAAVARLTDDPTSSGPPSNQSTARGQMIAPIRPIDEHTAYAASDNLDQSPVVRQSNDSLIEGAHSQPAAW